MVEFCLLIFNAALYYTISGFWLHLLSGIAPSYPGFLLLAVAITLDSYFRYRGMDKRYRLSLFLPLLTLLFSPGLIPFLHLLPIWGLTSFLILRDNTYLDRDEMKERFFFGLRLLLAILPGFFAGSRAAGSLAEVVPYLVIMLVSGVFCLRLLRNDLKNPLFQGLTLGLVITGSGLLSYFRILPLLGRGIGFIYDKIIARIIYFIAVSISYLVFGFFDLLRRLFLSMGFKSAENLPQLNDIAMVTEEEEGEVVELVNSPLLRIVGMILLTLLIFFIIYRVFKKLSERSFAGPKASTSYITGRQALGTSPKRRRPSIFRPRDPRQAVRYYFSRFMEEAASRGAVFTSGDTAREILAACRDRFSSQRAEDLDEIIRIYSPARYSESLPVTSRDAKKIKSQLKKLTQDRKSDQE